jgi:hypothetical protein
VHVYHAAARHAYAKGGAAALKTIGMSEERTRYLQLHEIDAEGLLRCSDVVVHAYCDADEEGRIGEDVDFDVTTSRAVAPKELRDGILYIHHHSQLAALASWVDMESMIHEAGYTWKGHRKQLQANNEAMHGLPQSEEAPLKGSWSTKPKALPLPIRLSLMG